MKIMLELLSTSKCRMTESIRFSASNSLVVEVGLYLPYVVRGNNRVYKNGNVLSSLVPLMSPNKIQGRIHNVRSTIRRY